MIEEAAGRIDYEECGAGPTIVLVPGSCSTGAAWRPVISTWKNQFRCVTTSLLGYGGTVERRTACDPSISHEAAALESVIRRAGDRVHLVGHSFGGLVALAVALRNNVSLRSLVIVEAPRIGTAETRGGRSALRCIPPNDRDLFRAFDNGDPDAIAAMIDSLLIRESISKAVLATIDGAAHFMIATHANEVGRVISQHAHRLEARS